MIILASHTFLEDLALVLCVAAVTTVLFQIVKQPVVVGYLIAGMIVGPNVPIPLLADSHRIHQLSELGVILLMFGLGLEFSPRKLIKLGPTSGFVTALQVGLMLWLGYVCGRAMGWTTLESIFTGALLSISSTTIVAKAYEEERVVDGKLRELVFGVLLAEDLTAVVELAVLTAMASGAAVSAELMLHTVVRLGLFLAVLVGLGFLIVPPLVRQVVRLGRPETTLVAMVGLCFAFAIIAQSVGYSVALGAFLCGSLVAESGDGGKVEHLVAPVRDMFGAVFFVSVGMMIDPALIVQHWVALVVLTFAVILGKSIGVMLASVLSGAGVRTSVEAGMSLAQIGEFSFIIAGVGLSLGATREFVYTLAVAVSAITTFTTPFMIRAAPPLAEFLAARLPGQVGALESLYDAWMERVWRAHRPASRRPVSLALALLVGSAAAVAGILIFAELDPYDLTVALKHALRLTQGEGDVAADLVTLLVCVVPAAGIYAGARNLAVTLAARALPKPLDVTEDETLGTSPARALIEMLTLTILLVTVIPLLAIVQPVMAPEDGVGIVVVTLAVMSVAVWRTARRVRGQMGAAVRLIASAIAGGPAVAFDWVGATHEVAGLGTLTPITVPAGATVVGKKLDEIDLHATTGATVVAIIRPDGHAIAPVGEESLRANDVLAVAGSSDAVTAAMRVLSRSGVNAPPVAAPAVV